MNLKDAIVPACALVITVAVLWRIAKEDPVFSEDEGKQERVVKQQSANAQSDSSVFWKTLALQYKNIADSFMLIKSQTTINDAVTSMHTAGVDSVKHVLLSEPR